MKSIFEIENRLDIQKEFRKFIKVFHNIDGVIDKDSYENVTVMEYFDRNIFKKCEFRDTILTIEEYLDFIGITYNVILGKEQITEEKFLRYVEFVLNMLFKAGNYFFSKIKSEIIEATLKNLIIIIEKMNYKFVELEDRVILSKRNADLDSVLKYVPKEISQVLLEYNDFRIENDLEYKKKLLKEIDLYLEKNINVRAYDKELSDTIGMIVNKMGVNHPINEEPFMSFSEDELLEWYDKCYLLMIHAIRWNEIKQVKDERKKIIIK